MSIKKNFAILFILFGVSFSSHAANYEISSYYKGLGCVFTIGEVASLAAANCFIGKQLEGIGIIDRVESYSTGTSGGVGFRGYVGDRYRGVITFRVSTKSCPDEQEINPVTGLCDIPPEPLICTPPQLLDPDTNTCIDPEPCPVGYIRNEVGLCVLDPEDGFCGSAEFTELLAQQSNNCAASNPDYFTNINSSCSDRENYSFTCVLGIEKPKDPTSPLSPPSGGFNPNNPDPINPTPPEFNKPEPDDVTPTDTTDTAVLEALRNLNRDNNQAFNSLNTDINTGFASTLDALNQSNSNLNAIGKSIVEQTNQDYMIHQANKLLQQQTTSEITKGASATVGAINSQTETLSNGLGDISDQLGEINDGLTGSVDSDGCSTFNCTGSAASCFVAQTQWRLRCDELERLSVLSSEGDGLLGDLADFANSAHDENGAFNKVFTDATGSVEEALDTYTTSNGFNFNSGCPQPRTYDLGAVGRITIDYTPFCKLALIFRALLMASAAIGSFLMIAKHM